MTTIYIIRHGETEWNLKGIHQGHMDSELPPKGKEQAKDLGFSGKGAIHPKQIADLNGVFTPSAEEIARARKVLTAFEAANTGLVVVDGKLIEKPVVRELQRILSVAGRAGG